MTIHEAPLLELLTPEQMGKADQLTIASGLSGVQLMENAGVGVFEHVMQEFGPQDTYLVLCGPGNNGGDGFVVARKLQETGKEVKLFLLGDKEKLTGDALHMSQKWDGDCLPLNFESFVTFLEGHHKRSVLIVDALFGAGLNRDISGDVYKIIEHINDNKCTVLSIDMPSGIDGEDGSVRGTAFQAHSSITFFRFKPGHFVYPGKEYCGHLKCVDIGVSEEVLDKTGFSGWRNHPALWFKFFPFLKQSVHKYKRGHAVVISGDRYKTGAARLGAEAALRMGAGLVTVFSPENAMDINAAHLTAVMLEKFKDHNELETLLLDERKNAVLIGPGAGVHERTKANVLSCLCSKAHVVLDADALTSFVDDRDELFSTIENQPDKHIIFTPHHGEFTRLFNLSGSKISGLENKIEKSCEAARLSGAVIVYKGADTVIASPDGRYALNYNAPVFLATAGSGDVLAGIITALLAQGMPGFEAACCGVWCHGEAAKHFGPGLIAEDLPDILPKVISSLYSG